MTTRVSKDSEPFATCTLDRAAFSLQRQYIKDFGKQTERRRYGAPTIPAACADDVNAAAADPANQA